MLSISKLQQTKQNNDLNNTKTLRAFTPTPLPSTKKRQKTKLNYFSSNSDCGRNKEKQIQQLTADMRFKKKSVKYFQRILFFSHPYFAHIKFKRNVRNIAYRRTLGELGIYEEGF